MVARSVGLALLTICALALPAVAQLKYELTAPQLNQTSYATVSDSELRIVDPAGRESIYRRDPRFDSSDGRFIGYRNLAGGQIVRWPSAGSGPMQLGTVEDGSVQYRASLMQVIARGGERSVGDGQLAVRPYSEAGHDGRSRGADFLGEVLRQPDLQPRVLSLVTRDGRGGEKYLGYADGERLTMLASLEANRAQWYVVPAGQSFVRVQQLVAGDWLALTADPRRGLSLQPAAQNVGQLWRVVAANSASAYWLESASSPGMSLAATASGAVTLLPLGSAPGQLWWPTPVELLPGHEPLWRSVSHEVRANPPLPPAQIELINSHDSPLLILIGDRRAPNVRQLRIEPSSHATVAFDRDAGATLVESYEIRGSGGVWDRQQFITQIPPAPIYDLSVYEVFLQSIAIDRTGTSPQVIEDINYQPKSVGFVILPPGVALPDRGQFDVYAEARAANNPGAVRRFDPRSLEKPSPTPDPLQAILNEVAPKNASPPASRVPEATTSPSVAPNAPPARQKF